jgi:tetratricopeptide (TPR) repeat protein
MRTLRVAAIVLVLVGLAPTAWAAEPPALAKARTLYNSGDYEGAIDAAAVARRQPPFADAAALVMARSYLERYRQNTDVKDLVAARETFRAIKASALAPRDRVDLIIGLGQMLYIGERFGAAAELFQNALHQSSLLGARDRMTLLDWWATALDREAQSRPVDRRRVVFERIGARMDDELRQDPGSSVANYWQAVALRGAGDVEGAWNAAIAAWVRSMLSPDTTVELRDDLDRLVMQALIPERSRLMAVRDPQEAVSALRAEWDLLKEQWK